MASMRAAIIRHAGGPEVLKIESLPVPRPTHGQCLIRVKACGLNRSELFTRQGHSPGVQFPRVLGIEAVGIVAECPAGEFKQGDIVATAMGGIGRQFDGGYAEYTCPPAKQVRKLSVHTSQPDWGKLGALPEMLQTAYGALFTSLRLQKGDHLLVRGGTTSVGLAAAAIARHYGATVSSTSRSESSIELLRSSGATDFFIESGGDLATQIKERYPGGVDKVLELVGATTMLDSLQCVKTGGIVCMAGIVGGKWTLNQFTPSEAIPTGVFLTRYGSSAEAFLDTPFEELAQLIDEGKIPLIIGKTFKLDEIVEAHRCMEENRARGKLVLLT